MLKLDIYASINILNAKTNPQSYMDISPKLE